MKNLFYKYDVNVEKAYIITVKGNDTSEKYSERCAESCDLVGMPYEIWEAYDGTKDGLIISPKHLTDDSFMNLIKVTNSGLVRGEVACALSHISLWLHCALIQKPIVILEHDAIMIKKYTQKMSMNSVCYLGGSEWAEQTHKIEKLPLFAADGRNYFICRAHAYAIDPLVAKNMLSSVLNMGIYAPADMMIKMDMFNIYHEGFYAYDKPKKIGSSEKIAEDTTIFNRIEGDNGYNRAIKNPNLDK